MYEKNRKVKKYLRNTKRKKEMRTEETTNIKQIFLNARY